MAKNDSDLFDRLRQAGVRKQVARTLSGIGEGASKKAVRAARSAVSELRSLADEIERRLPSATRSRTASVTEGRRAQRPATKRKSPAAPRAKTAAAARTNGARAPRGQNKAMILASLKSGPKTASEIAKETGIRTGTVSSMLSKMATAGEVAKADRGYGLPN
jgi:alkaline phosphatase